MRVSMIGDRSYLRGSCWFVAGNANACSLPLDSQRAAPPPSPSIVQLSTSAPRPYRRLEQDQLVLPLRPNLRNLRTAAKSP